MTELLQERLFPQISNFVYSLILSLTTTDNKANAKTKWVCQQYLNGKFQSLDDGIVDRLLDLMKAYNKYESKLKPIMNYKNPEELEDDIISVNNSGYKTKAEFDAIARKGTQQIYKDKEFIILKINNWVAAKKYGANTKWCISTRYDDETFNHYQEASHNQIYFIIDRKIKDCKYACVDGVVYDEWDTLLFTMKTEDTRLGDGSELEVRLKEHPQLVDVFVKAIPSYKEEDIKERINNTIKS